MVKRVEDLESKKALAKEKLKESSLNQKIQEAKLEAVLEHTIKQLETINNYIQIRKQHEEAEDILLEVFADTARISSDIQSCLNDLNKQRLAGDSQ